jgi:hypothetical protein
MDIKVVKNIPADRGPPAAPPANGRAAERAETQMQIVGFDMQSARNSHQ